MTGFSLSENYILNPEALLRKNRSCTSSSASPSSKTVAAAPSATNEMAYKTLHEYSVPAVTNVPTGPAINVGDKNFEL